MATTATGIEAARTLDELYRAHAAEVFRYAYAVLGNRADAEDITQTTFINALRALERGEQPHTPKNWLIAISHNLIRQRFRQQQTRPRQVELDHDLPAVEVDDDGPSLDDLVRALQRIPPAQREALVLRELEGRSYEEIAALLGVSQSALETLIFRARRSLAEELENLVTCDAAELALSRATDGRLGRKERRRLRAHLDECASCARNAARSMKYRRAFKTLAVLPLPFSLTLFKGAPSASAATGLPTIGAAAGSGAAVTAAGGLSAKIAVGLTAVAVAGGAGYEGVKAVQEPAPAPKPAAKVIHAAAPQPARPRALAPTPAAAKAKPAAGTKPAAVKPVKAAKSERGRSSTAPGQLKPKPARGTPRLGTPRGPGNNAAGTKLKTPRGAGPAAERPRGKSAVAPGRLQTAPAKAEPTAKPAKAAKVTKPKASPKPPKQDATAKPEKPAKLKQADVPDAAAAAPGRGPKS